MDEFVVGIGHIISYPIHEVSVAGAVGNQKMVIDDIKIKKTSL